MRFALGADNAPVVVVQSVGGAPAAVVWEAAREVMCIPAAVGLYPAFAFCGMNRPVVGHNDYTYFTCQSYKSPPELPNKPDARPASLAARIARSKRLIRSPLR